MACQCRCAFFVHFPTLPPFFFCIFAVCHLRCLVICSKLEQLSASCCLVVFLCSAKQARAKAAPYPRQMAASTQFRRATERRDFYAPARERFQQATRTSADRIICYKCGGRVHVIYQCYASASASASSPPATTATESRPYPLRDG
jgi:hypothetical protein